MTETKKTSAFRVDGKVALVTGGAQGLGAAIAEVLGEAGAAVLVTDINGEGAQATAARIRAAGGRAEATRHDVTDEAQWDAAVDTAITKLGGLDILVNNAGIELVRLLVETTLEEFRRVQRINVEGVFMGMVRGMQVMRPGGRVGKGGAIINISSAAGLKSNLTLGAYSASKGAVRRLSDAAAMESAALGYGIRVNAVHPGLCDTRMGTDTVMAMSALASIPEERRATLLASPIPLPVGTPRDIANGVLYLASDAGQWITGTGLVIDGGHLAV